jgi:hypothetical protein
MLILEAAAENVAVGTAASNALKIRNPPVRRVRRGSVRRYSTAGESGTAVALDQLLNFPAGWCLPGIFVDGVRIEQSPEVPVDDFFRADHLEGIEVYSSAARVPIEFQQGGRVACGAVLLWTRQGQPGGGRSGWWRWVAGLGAFGGILLFML